MPAARISPKLNFRVGTDIGAKALGTMARNCTDLIIFPLIRDTVVSALDPRRAL